MKDEKLKKTYLDFLKQEITKSWDRNVITRALDLEHETDYSYVSIIKPWIIQKVMDKTNDDSAIVDIGCGCGYLTNLIYKTGRQNITGIDISPISIMYAKKKYPQISFKCMDFCDIERKKNIDVCLAVMMINYVADIKRFFDAACRLLVTKGKLILVIPHPWFWPQRHIRNSEYSYENEVPYTYHFATKGRSDYDSDVIYFHRKLETYLYYAQQAGFQITELQELTEGKDCKYPDILCVELMLLT